MATQRSQPGRTHPIRAVPLDSLPNEVAALCLVCDCCDLRGKALKPFSRQKLKRAREERGISPEEIKSVEALLWEKTMARFRRHKIAPASTTNNFTDELVSSLLTLYGRIRTRVVVPPEGRTRALWIIAEYVVIPTVFTIMVRYQGIGLGAEFSGERSWYVANPGKRGPQRPIPRILDRWLRVAGFRTPYGVARKPRKVRNETETRDEEREFRRWEADKKWVERCRSGKHVPRLRQLERLARRFRASIGWLDDVDSWRARFALAYLLHRGGEAADRAFAELHTLPSTTLAKRLLKITRERYLCDDGRVLAGAHLFWASRLLQRRLEATGELKRIIESVPKDRSAIFGPEVSQEEIEAWKRKTSAEMNVGNRFLNYLCAGNNTSVEEHLFKLGLRELQLLIDEKVGGRSRRPETA